MRPTYALPILMLLPFLSCSEMPMVSGDAMCNCPTPSAAQISYSNTTSHLASTNVQAAVDELAAKPVEAPIGPRIMRVVRSVPNNGQTSFTAVGACSDETHDIVLGGDCGDGPSSGVALVRTSITLSTTEAKFGCEFSQPAGSSAAAQVGVLCLTNAR
jgi:hypothetical protein